MQTLNMSLADVQPLQRGVFILSTWPHVVATLRAASHIGLSSDKTNVLLSCSCRLSHAHIPDIPDICAFQSYQMSHLFIPRRRVADHGPHRQSIWA